MIGIKRIDFLRSHRFTPWLHGLVSLVGLILAYALYGMTLFVIGIGHMHPAKPEYYLLISLGIQLLPLLLSVLCWLLFLWSFRKKWLIFTGITWLVVASSIPLLSHWVQSGAIR
jgi:hypothetical protein